jgi:Domain of unknown function (DUF4333)
MRAKMIRMAAAAILLTAASCSKQVLDTGHLQTTLKQQLEAQLGARNITVTCPNDVKVLAGATFKCTVAVPSSGTLTIDVTQTDDKGNVSYQIVGLTLPSGSPSPPTSTPSM